MIHIMPIVQVDEEELGSLLTAGSAEGRTKVVVGVLTTLFNLIIYLVAWSMGRKKEEPPSTEQE